MFSWWRTMQESGGLWNSIKIIYRRSDLRVGTLVGEDANGNKYYENLRYQFGRHRFVDYKLKEFDASQVPPEWHGWLHYMTDNPPTKVPPVPRKFHAEHQANWTGTTKDYVPYSTTRPRIQSWIPPTNKQ
ncbi:hypothetical protein LOD99_12711 [Oopsacas minuta]|uniref:NADH dehydrogenase [ubiquinone] 1 alpha subcomplex subunit 12 n=1 Tax=Oopsacas minuta TaxID=111878 RepID=A0AAV7JCT5_9METZ|nr:hypothetical protein LOD99_12711 [Oopsacas minuta]